jgi:hypothetical protein
VFVGWIGIDEAGTYCISAGFMPSVFRLMSGESIYIQAAGGDKKNFIFF